MRAMAGLLRMAGGNRFCPQCGHGAYSRCDGNKPRVFYCCSECLAGAAVRERSYLRWSAPHIILSRSVLKKL